MVDGWLSCTISIKSLDIFALHLLAMSKIKANNKFLFEPCSPVPCFPIKYKSLNLYYNSQKLNLW